MQRTVFTAAVTAVALALFAPSPSQAATGCTLNDPDRDVMRIFPDATAYVTDFIAVSERGGDDLTERIEAQLGDTLDAVFEAADVPYAYYTVLDEDEVVGRVHGVNQKGMFGGMQLILATDPEGRIVDFYYQKLSSPEAGKFRNASFTDLFTGLTLEDLLAGHEQSESDTAVSPMAAIEDPSKESGEDFYATLRGLRKNLILLHEFLLTPESAPDTEDNDE